MYEIRLLFNHSFTYTSLGPHGLQHSRLPCLSPTPRAYSNSCPSRQWCHPTISSSVIPSPPTFNLYQHKGLFEWVSSPHQLAKILEFQLQHHPSTEYSGLTSFRITFLYIHHNFLSLGHHNHLSGLFAISTFFAVPLFSRIPYNY